MATISVDTYLDVGVTRTTGESWTINNNATLTIRTDTRWHAMAPANMTGAIGSITINEGTCFIDATKVRWMAYNSGSGTVPAIGTTITQGSVSGYLLGVWSSLLTPPTAVGAAMPTTGFLKFREVTNGPFIAGTLTGISATATSSDVTGWLEIVHNQASDITVGRRGLYKTRGDRFYLGNTTGVVGETFQIPKNDNSTATIISGVYVEKTVNSDNNDDNYDFYPNLYSSANGWAVQHSGGWKDVSDKRKKFCNSTGDGLVRFSQNFSQSIVGYTTAGAVISGLSFTSAYFSGTYTWSNNTIYINITDASGCFFENGELVGLDFTSGSATDGLYNLTVIDQFTLTATLAGSGTGGNVTLRYGYSATYGSTHGFYLGQKVWATASGFTSQLVELCNVNSTTSFVFKLPHTSSTTYSTGSIYYGWVVTTSGNHNLTIGQQITFEPTSGAGVSGNYIINKVSSTTAFVIPFHDGFTGDMTAGVGNITGTIGFIVPAGRRVWISNIIGRQSVAGAGAINVGPHATITSRPEFNTTSSGVVDIEYLTADWYFSFSQAYSLSLKYISTFDRIGLGEITNYVTLYMGGLGMYGGLDTISTEISYLKSGILIDKWVSVRGNTPSTSDHNCSITACNNVTISNSKFAIGQDISARSTGYSLTCNYINNLIINDCIFINSQYGIYVTTCYDVEINNCDYTDRFNGFSNKANVGYLVYIGVLTKNVLIDNPTIGHNNVIKGCGGTAVAAAVTCENITIRNFGSIDNYIPQSNTWYKGTADLYAIVVAGSGYSNNINIQRCYVERLRNSIYLSSNIDENFTVDNVYVKYLMTNDTTVARTSLVLGITSSNTLIRSSRLGYISTSGQTAVFGTNFVDHFMGDTTGELVLIFNEPNSFSSPYYTILSGLPKFNSVGALVGGISGQSVVFETPYYIKGYTGFLNKAPILNGGTWSQYTFEYQIDNTGTGVYSGWKTLNTTNLLLENITSNIGFKMKIKITTITTNTSLNTHLRIFLSTTYIDQTSVLLPLTESNFTFVGLKPNSEIRCYQGTDPSTAIPIGGVENSSDTFTFKHTSGGTNGYFHIHALGYISQYIEIEWPENDYEYPIQQVIDRNYLNV